MKAGFLVFLCIFGLLGCDAPRPTREDLVGTWEIGNTQDRDTGAKIELRSDGRAILTNWPAWWLNNEGDRRHAATGSWSYISNKTLDPTVIDLVVDHVDDGLKPTQMPVSWGLFFGKTYLEVAVRDPDSGLPTFYRAN